MMTEPIDVREQQPALGQRCHVYDSRYKEWCYAYWQRNDGPVKFEGGYFYTARPASEIVRIKARYWMSEPPTPQGRQKMTNPHESEARRLTAELDGLGPEFDEDGVVKTVLRRRIGEAWTRAAFAGEIEMLLAEKARAAKIIDDLLWLFELEREDCSVVNDALRYLAEASYQNPSLAYSVRTVNEMRRRRLIHDWPRIRDLPPDEQEPFAKWLRGQTVPTIEGEPDSEQDGYFHGDYERWKAGLPVID